MNTLLTFSESTRALGGHVRRGAEGAVARVQLGVRAGEPATRLVPTSSHARWYPPEAEKCAMHTFPASYDLLRLSISPRLKGYGR